MTKKRSILIVEDEGLIALQLQEILQTSGYSVPDPVISGEIAIEYVRYSFPPDLILMDIRLGGIIDGIETAMEIQKLADIPILFLSAHPYTEQIAVMAIIAPCSFLEKPFMEFEVISAVEKALHRAADSPTVNAGA